MVISKIAFEFPIRRQRARDVYGVVSDERGTVDEAATAERRKALGRRRMEDDGR
jgi:hypothetical protein